jgi:O-antigen ligase
MPQQTNEDVQSAASTLDPAYYGAYGRGVYQFRATFWFTTCYFLIAQGRIHLLIPFLTALPCAMISGILAVLAYLMESKRSYEKRVWGREEKLVLGFLAVCLVTLPTSIWLGGSVSALFKTFIPMIVLLFITANICLSMQNIKNFVWIFAVNSSFIIYLVLGRNVGHYTEHITDTYDSNDIAMILVCALPILINFMRCNQGVRKKLLLLCSLLIVATVIKTASRGGMLGLVALALYMAMNSGSKLKYFALLCIAFICFLSFAPEEAVERFSSMYKPQTEYDQNLGDRTQIWESGGKLILASPLLGVGFGNYPEANGAQIKSGAWKTAHNSLLQAAVELGLGGFVLLVMLSAGTFLKFRRLRIELESDESASETLWLVRGIELSLLAYMVTGFFLSQAYNAQFFFVISLAIAVQKFIPQKTAVPEAG